MRLINADYLSKELRKSTELLNGNTLVPVNLLLTLIEKTPTAYDTDKVVEKLEKECYRIDDSATLSSRDVVNIEDAIEIVKVGDSD